MQTPLRIVRAPHGGPWHLPVEGLEIQDRTGTWCPLGTVVGFTADATHPRRIVAYVVAGRRVDPSEIGAMSPERLRVAPAPVAEGPAAPRAERAPVQHIEAARARRLHRIVGVLFPRQPQPLVALKAIGKHAEHFSDLSPAEADAFEDWLMQNDPKVINAAL